MTDYIIVTESGADLSRELIERHNICVLPMHVMVDGKDYFDGEISMGELCSFYDKKGKVPTTSAVNPHEYRQEFERIRSQKPEAVIIHISYSSMVSSTYQNAMIAADGIDNIYHIDSLNVSAGQAIIVMKAVKIIESNPDISVEDLVQRIKQCAASAKFAFLPGNLDYLRAGGRVSNAQYLGAALLKITPLIDIIGGKLISTKKFRGSRQSVVRQMAEDFMAKFKVDKEEAYLVSTHGVDDLIKSEMERVVREQGIANITWLQTGSVITSHAGPGGIGIAALTID